jgi:hypothetical protein
MYDAYDWGNGTPHLGRANLEKWKETKDKEKA